MLNQLRPALFVFVALTLITGVAYPYAVTGVAQLAFPYQSKGSPIERDGKVIGAEIIGQNFASERYFHGRLSATTATDPNDSTKTVPAPYNAGNSSASNAGPTSKALIERVQADAAKLKAENPNAPVPVDLITTTGSGLDPHVTPAGALFQVPRVAKARGLDEARLRKLVEDSVEGRLLGLVGEPRVNVLKLNLALDALG
jgi:K+-transporting ATPase ATPase C chain